MRFTHVYTKKNYPRIISGHGWFRQIITQSRLYQIQKTVSVRKDDYILDIGCDEGALLQLLHPTVANVYGIDINPDAVSTATLPGIRKGSAEAIPFPSCMFDICIASHVIEHLKSPQCLFEEASRVLKHNGKLVLIYPWEPFRGASIIIDVILSLRIPRLSLIREIHRNILSPHTLKPYVDGTFQHVKSRMFFRNHLVPEYISVFVKSA